jgi:hypothetical protein
MTCLVVALTCLASAATARGWQELEKGLYYGKFVSPQKSPVCNYPIVILNRIWGGQYLASLFMGSQTISVPN